MLLVHHHQPELGHGREHRRARAHDHPRLALTDPPPLVVALPRRELAVQHRHGRPEAGARRAHEHGREPDLGHEQDRPAAAREGRLGGAEIDLRLSAARDAVQQERAEARVAHGRQKIAERPLLVLGGNHGQRLAGRQFRGRPQLALRIEAQRSLLRQPVHGAPQRRPIAHEVRHAQAAARRAQARDDLGLRRAARRSVFLDERRDLELAEAGRVDRLLHRHDSVAPQPRDARLRVAAEALLERAQAQRAVLQVPQQGVVGPSRLHEPHDRTAGAHPRGWQHEPVALARRCQVVVGDEAREVEKRRRHERRLVEDLRAPP